MARLGRALMGFNGVMAAGFLVTGIVMLVISGNASGRAPGALGLLDSGMLAFAAVMPARQLNRTQHNATMALRLNREQS